MAAKRTTSRGYTPTTSLVSTTPASSDGQTYGTDQGYQPSEGVSGSSGSSSSSPYSTDNPWSASIKSSYDAISGGDRYRDQWDTAVSQAMALGGKDYTSQLRGFAQEDVANQIRSADNQLGAIGMRELGLASDVQADRAKLRTDASTRATTDAQTLQRNAISSMESMLSSASANELNWLSAAMEAALAGGNSWDSQTSSSSSNRTDNLAAAFKLANMSDYQRALFYSNLNKLD